MSRDRNHGLYRGYDPRPGLRPYFRHHSFARNPPTTTACASSAATSSSRDLRSSMMHLEPSPISRQLLGRRSILFYVEFWPTRPIFRCPTISPRTTAACWRVRRSSRSCARRLQSGHARPRKMTQRAHFCISHPGRIALDFCARWLTEDMTDETAIIAANAAFYAAFAAGDISEVPASGRTTTTFPVSIRDGRRLSGERPSWKLARHSPKPEPAADRLCRAPRHHRRQQRAGALHRIRQYRAACASNHFRRIDGAWRLVHHQSSPIAQMVTPANDDIPSRRIH